MTKPSLTLPVLMLVTDRRLAMERMLRYGDEALVHAVAEAVEGGVDIVQLREKDLSDDELVQIALPLKKAIGNRALLVINGSSSVAKRVGADGVNLPENAPSGDVSGLLVGRSAHSVVSAKRASDQGADYVVVGSVFETRTHPGNEPQGVELIRESAAVCTAPVVAIGGITRVRVPRVIAAGADGIAVISGILASESPREAALALRTVIDEAYALRTSRP